MELLAGRNLFYDRARMAVARTGIVSGTAAQKRSEELLAGVAHKAHSFAADLSGGEKQRVLSSGERMMHREAGGILWEERNVLTAPNETSLLADVPPVGAAASHPASRPTQPRTIERLSPHRGASRRLPERGAPGRPGKELHPAPMNRVIVRKLGHTGQSVPFDSPAVAMADDSGLRLRLDSRLAVRNTPCCR